MNYNIFLQIQSLVSRLITLLISLRSRLDNTVDADVRCGEEDGDEVCEEEGVCEGRPHQRHREDGHRGGQVQGVEVSHAHHQAAGVLLVRYRYRYRRMLVQNMVF